MTPANDFSPPSPTAGPATTPTCEASIVNIGYIWLLVLLPTAGLALWLVSLVGQPNALVLAVAAALVASGYWAWRRAYQFVRLELLPGTLRIQFQNPAQPSQDIPLDSIANYLRPQETYYRVLELQLHGGRRLHLSKRLRSPAGLLSLDAWIEVLAERLEQARPVAAPGVAAGVGAAAASGLLATPPRVFARTMPGKILAGLAVAWLLLALFTLLGPTPWPAAMFVLPSLYLGYYARAKGALKIETKRYTGVEASRDDD